MEKTEMDSSEQMEKRILDIVQEISNEDALIILNTCVGRVKNANK